VSEERLARRLQLSSALVLAGLGVQAGSLGWRHPTAFIVFMLGGGLLLAAGVLLFLWSVVSLPKRGE
jgi:hypothetical protein